jgi:hypothetical protein
MEKSSVGGEATMRLWVDLVQINATMIAGVLMMISH